MSYRLLIIFAIPVAFATACGPIPQGRAGSPSVSTVSIAPPAPGARGLVVAPAGGERFVYCARPLTLWVKVDSISAPGTQLVAGTGVIHGDEGVARHPDADEVIYIRRGWGHGVIGSHTVRFGPGSVAYVPAGTRHQLVSSPGDSLEYFWILGPRSSAAAFRRAARIGCPGGAAAPPAAAVVSAIPSVERPGVVIDPGAGDRLTYCPFPLTVTFKIDSTTAPGSRLVAVTGALRRGSEVGTHPVDEVVLITHGQGRGFVGADTLPVEAGSIVYTPRGMRHGFINDGGATLEYLVVYGPYESARSRAGFHRLASQPGRYCVH